MFILELIKKDTIEQLGIIPLSYVCDMYPDLTGKVWMDVKLLSPKRTRNCQNDFLGP